MAKKTADGLKFFDFVKEPKGYTVHVYSTDSCHVTYKPIKPINEIKIFGIFTQEDIKGYIKFSNSSEKLKTPGANALWCVYIHNMYILYDGERWLDFYMMSYGSNGYVSYGYPQDNVPEYVLTTNDKEIIDELIADYIERKVNE